MVSSGMKQCQRGLVFKIRAQVPPDALRAKGQAAEEDFVRPPLKL